MAAQVPMLRLGAGGLWSRNAGAMPEAEGGLQKVILAERSDSRRGCQEAESPEFCRRSVLAR
jgi:hypothetical protein